MIFFQQLAKDIVNLSGQVCIHEYEINVLLKSPYIFTDFFFINLNHFKRQLYIIHYTFYF